MNRRGFLTSLIGAAVAAQQLDIEQLLWTPTKTIFIPPPPVYRWYTLRLGLPEPTWVYINEAASMKCPVRTERITVEEFGRRYPDSLPAGSWVTFGEYLPKRNS